MLAQRLATAMVALPLAIAGILFLPTVFIAAIFTLLVLVGLWEWGAFFNATYRMCIVMSGVLIAGIAWLALWRHSGPAAPIAYGLMFFSCFCWLFAIGGVLRFSPGHIGIMAWPPAHYGIGTLMLMAPAVAVARLHASAAGPELVLAFFFIVWAADTGAYTAGRLFGRHKLAPRVSPGKTWEGAIGGLIISAIIAGIAAWLIGYEAMASFCLVALGVWVAIMSIVGDLTLSMFKRNAGVKDSGTLFPGHGGVLDRLDSVIAAAPWFVLGVHWLALA